MSAIPIHPNYGKPWSRDELVLVFDLYCRLPFSKTKATNADVAALASLIGRSPAAIARKLGNFGSLDPALKSRDISGLGHTSSLDRAIWGEFHHDWNSLVEHASELRARITGEESPIDELVFPSGPSEKTRLRRERLHQSFFRDAVLSSYDSICCVTGISLPECLVACHIVPWSTDIRHRADPTNGLCLSATFEKLFDRGSMTILDDLTVLMSPSLRSVHDGPNYDLILSYNGVQVRPPRRFSPSGDRLKWHRENIFQS